MSTEQTCGNCRFWNQGDKRGECRAHPPQYMPGTSMFDWPSTMHNDWCGEWMPPGKEIAKLFDLMSYKTRKALDDSGFKTLEEVADAGSNRIHGLDGIRVPQLDEIRKLLEEHGMSFSDEQSDNT